MSTKSLQNYLLAFTLLSNSIAMAQLQIVTPFAGSSCGGSTFANAISASGVLTCATPSASSVVLNNISAATGANTIANGNNTGQVWNWTSTTNNTSAFTYGETTAATNGTSTSGVPNQVLVKVATLSGSTQSPLSVYSRGTHVFSVSPSEAQILGGIGSLSAPTYSFASSPTTGIWADGSGLRFQTGGAIRLTIGGTGIIPNAIPIYAVDGNAAAPSYAFQNGVSAGFFLSGSELGMSVSGIENSRLLAGGIQNSKGSADTTGYAINSRKSRGTVAAPSAITSGDDLLTITGAGYVGAVNTYRNAATIMLGSTGTISDATNGIGGAIGLSTQKQGTDTSPKERMRIDQLGHFVSIAGTANTPSVAACGTSPSVSGTDNAMLVTVGTGGIAASCAVSFGSTWAGNAPVCVAQNDTDIVAYKISATTTGVTISASSAFSASSKFNVICIGQQ